MFIKYIQLALLSLLVTTGLMGCGGGGSSSDTPPSNPTDPNMVFKTFTDNYYGTAPYRESYKVTGIDSYAGPMEGTFFVSKEPQSTFLNSLVNPFYSMISLKAINNGGTLDSITRYYVTPDKNNLLVIGYTAPGTRTTLSNPVRLPAIVKIGDFGSQGSYSDNVGDTIVNSWRVEDGQNGLIKLIADTKTFSQYGELKISGTTTYLQDATGYRKHVTAEGSNYVLGFERILSGDNLTPP